MLKAFEDKIKQIAEKIRKLDDFVIISHFDADGITAAAIMIKALEREGKKASIKIVKQLYSETIAEIKQSGKNFLFTDFGSGQIDVLKKEFAHENFFVLDHHLPKEEFEFQLNPNYFRIDGGKEISGAGISYLVAKKLNEKNADLAHLAVVGAIGDMQEAYGRLEGLNREILADAEKNGLIKTEMDLRLYGRISRPLVQYLLFSSNPIIPEITANEENCKALLKEIGIKLKEKEHWRSYSDLSLEEKQKLVSALMVHLVNAGLSEWKAKKIIGEVFTLLKEEPKSMLRDGKEFATLLNATGRHGMSEIGLKICLGEKGEAYKKAMNLVMEHRKQLKQGIDFVQEKGIDEREEFYLFDAEDKIGENIVGIVAGMLYGSKLIEADKPIIALAKQSEGTIKVSARATMELVEKGLNLGKILREICEQLGEKSEGGGHKIASGCRIEENEKEKFLELLGKKIKEEMQTKNYT